MDQDHLHIGPEPLSGFDAWWKQNRMPLLLTALIALAVAGMFLLPVYKFKFTSSNLRVVTWITPAQAQPDDSADGFWELEGRVLNEDGKPVPGANVSAISSDRQGNRFSPKPQITDRHGWFALEKVSPQI
ncbi:MAG: hypothetical protein BZY88_15470 [SAR202 cluster bacterium Io17-Chloro-G9]|nr:MAG: hypothetical protein BZY88_15470 [SAR202 cluster bacterium Io17-Chloro-G9]